MRTCLTGLKAGLKAEGALLWRSQCFSIPSFARLPLTQVNLCVIHAFFIKPGQRRGDTHPLTHATALIEHPPSRPESSMVADFDVNISLLKINDDPEANPRLVGQKLTNQRFIHAEYTGGHGDPANPSQLAQLGCEHN